MTKKYQKNEIDTPAGDGFGVPERVSVAMAEIAGSMREGLLALAVGTGLQGSPLRPTELNEVVADDTPTCSPGRRSVLC